LHWPPQVDAPVGQLPTIRTLHARTNQHKQLAPVIQVAAGHIRGELAIAAAHLTQCLKIHRRRQRQRWTGDRPPGLLTKLLDIARLRQALDRFGLARRTLELPAQSAAGADRQLSEAVDLMTLHAKFSGDMAFVRRLCQTFVTSMSLAIEEIDSAVAAGERTRVRLLAHKIKGGGSSVYAHRLAAIAANIESAALTAAIPELIAAIDTLRKAFDEATLYIGARLT
jgi:HPt (histidine-containing phosphotransfer) domain-containing protein